MLNAFFSEISIQMQICAECREAGCHGTENQPCSKLNPVANIVIKRDDSKIKEISGAYWKYKSCPGEDTQVPALFGPPIARPDYGNVHSWVSICAIQKFLQIL